MTQQYSHRNGETETPTIAPDDMGEWFWYDGGDTEEFECFGMFWVSETYAMDTTGNKIPLVKLTGRWWGPVTPPWATNG